MFPLNKIYIALGAAVLALIAGLWIANSHLRAELADSRADLAVCRVANNAFAAAVAEQNARVERLRADGNDRAARAEVARKQAQEVAEKRRRALDGLLRATPRQADACRATDALFNDYWRVLK